MHILFCDLSAQFEVPAVRHTNNQNGLDADFVYLATSPEWDEDFIDQKFSSNNFNTERNF